MDITLNNVVALHEKMSQFMEEEKGIPSNIKYRMSRLLLKLSGEIEGYTKARNEIITRLGEKSEDGRVTVSRESANFPKFIEENDALLSESINISETKAFKLSEVYSFMPGSLIQLFSYVGLLEDDDEETAEKLSA